jgi:hypothetical protein
MSSHLHGLARALLGDLWLHEHNARGGNGIGVGGIERTLSHYADIDLASGFAAARASYDYTIANLSWSASGYTVGVKFTVEVSTTSLSSGFSVIASNVSGSAYGALAASTTMRQANSGASVFVS